MVQLGHAFPISCMDKHPIKSWIATGAPDNQIKIWDYNLRKLVTTLKGHSDGIKLLKFMPGTEQYILSASAEDQRMILWEINSGKQIQVYKHEYSFWPEGLGFTASDANGKPGKYFYAGHQFGIEKWETMTGKLVEKLDMDSLIHDGKYHWVHNFTYATDLNCSFFNDGPTVYMFDHTLGVLSTYFIAKSGVHEIDYNPVQKIIALACSDNFYVVDLNTKKELYYLEKTGNGYEHTISLSDNGELLFLNETNQFSHIINWKMKKDLIWFNGHAFNDAVFVENGEYAILTGNKGYPAMYNVNTLELRPFFAIDNGIKALAFFNNDHYILKAGNENNVRIFDLQSADYIGALEGHTGLVWYATSSKSGRYLVTSSADQTIKVWDPATYKCITTVKSPYPIADLYSGDLSSVAFKKVLITDDDKYIISYLQGNGATGKKNGYVWKWEIATGKLVDEFQNDVKRLAMNAWFSVSDIAINPVKDEMIVCSYENLILIKTSNFKIIKKDFDKDHDWFSDVEYSKDGKLLCVNYNQGSLDFWDAEKYIKIKGNLRMPPTYIFSMEFNQDGTLLAAAGGFDDNRVFIVDTKTFEIVKKMEGHDSWVMSVKWNKEGTKLFSGGQDSKLILWNIDSAYPEVTLVNNANTEDYVFYNKKGNYKITRSGFKNVAFSSGTSLFPFEQFDIKFNRPDLILKSLGSENTELIDLYRKAYEKRLKSLGLKESEMIQSFYMPQLSSSSIPYNVSDKEVKIRVTASDTVYKLKSMNIRVNEIPLLGKTGLELGGKSIQSFEKEFTIPLNSGKNRIEVSCINEQGAESLRQVYDVTTTYEFPKPNLYIIAVSVSNYKDPNWNLKYATKDGKDIAQLFSKGFYKSYNGRSNENYFNTLNGGVLFDTAATRDRFMQVKKLLAGSKPNDQIVVFFSGHGLLDKKYDFYYATYDCDFNHPESKGLSFADIEEVLDAAPARNKLLFIDACHSGEVDKEAIEISKDTNAIAGARNGVVSYHTKGSELLDKNSKLSFSNSFNLMKEIFAGSEIGTGTVIISAAAGDSYALESDLWSNGIFTYAILEGIKNGAADADQNKEIIVTELKNYLIKEVYRQTNGRQKPTCRKENLEYDFRVK